MSNRAEKLRIRAGTGVVSLIAIAGISSCSSSPGPAPPAHSPVPSSAPAPHKPAAPHKTVPKPVPVSHKHTASPAPAKTSHKPAPVAAARHCELRAHGDLPDPACTPGDADHRVTQADIGRTICVAGYTRLVRPPESVTSKMKFDVSYPMYGLAHGVKTEYDHLIPLELGGSSSIRNLWPDPTPVIPTAKDAVGNRLHQYVCDGRMSLATAQHVMATDWRTAPALGSTPPPAPVTPQKPAPPASAAPKAPEPASGGYHWRQQANGLRCVDGDGKFAKSALCGARP